MPAWSRPEFDRDELNEHHITERHGVYPAGAEQAFYKSPHVRRDLEVYYAYGRNDDGHDLFVVFVLRESAIRVISARSMSRQERQLYDRHH